MVLSFSRSALCIHSLARWDLFADMYKQGAAMGHESAVDSSLLSMHSPRRVSDRAQEQTYIGINWIMKEC